MRSSALLGSCLTLALALAGCQDQVTSPVASVPGPSLQTARVAGGSLERGSVSLPETFRITDRRVAALAGPAIDPSDYVCSTTEINDWWLERALDALAREPDIFGLLYFDLLVDEVLTYEALYFATDDTPQHFGYDGEYTKVMKKTERDVKRFWDIQSDGIQLVGLHGTTALDTERMTRAYNQIYGVPLPTASLYATLVRDALLASEALNGGNHPVFSFNAFAITTFGGSIPDKIVMGDGVLAGYEELGFGDVAPQAIYAHEFAHHIQFQNGYFEDEYATTGSAAEQTRYTELMADAMSAYYLTHKRGGTMNKHRVAQFLQVFYQIGDCGFTSSGHHGTPNQRMAAAQFGFDLADQAQKQGHILPADEFYARFVAAYPTLIAPDAP